MKSLSRIMRDILLNTVTNKSPMNTTPDTWEEEFREEFVAELAPTGLEAVQSEAEPIINFIKNLLSQKTQRDIERLEGIQAEAIKYPLRSIDKGYENEMYTYNTGYDKAISDAIAALKETK